MSRIKCSVKMAVFFGEAHERHRPKLNFKLRFWVWQRTLEVHRQYLALPSSFLFVDTVLTQQRRYSRDVLPYTGVMGSGSE